jgi:hypothetical protein
MTTADAIREMLRVWNELTAAARAANPTATEADIEEFVRNRMSAELGIPLRA